MSAGGTAVATMLGRYLKHRREELRLKQADVASRIKMDQSEWSKWETGKIKRPSPEQIRDFARALEDSVVNIALAVAGLWPPTVTDSDGQLTTRLADPDSYFRIYDLLARLHETTNQLATELGVKGDEEGSEAATSRQASA